MLYSPISDTVAKEIWPATEKSTWRKHWAIYLAKLIQIQNLPLHMRDTEPGSLQLPELSNLVQEVELDSGESLEG